MSENLKFKSDDFYNLILAKLVELKTEVVLSKATIGVLWNNQNDDDKKKYETLLEVLAEQRPLMQSKIVDELMAELKGISIDADDFLKGLLD